MKIYSISPYLNVGNRILKKTKVNPVKLMGFVFNQKLNFTVHILVV